MEKLLPNYPLLILELIEAEKHEPCLLKQKRKERKWVEHKLEKGDR